MSGVCQWCGVVTDKLARARVIVDEVAAEHRASSEAIRRESRAAYLVAARACAMRRIRDETGLKLTAIGEFFGRDHSTVLHHLNGTGRGKTEAAAEPSGRAGSA